MLPPHEVLNLSLKQETDMSEHNVNVVKGMYEAFARGDVPAVLGVFDPAIEWREADGFIYADGNPYIGPTAVLEGVFMRLATEWDHFTASPEGLLDAGEAVVAHGYYGGTYKKTGKSVRAQFAHFFTMRDGKVVKFQQYTDTLQFQRAVGG
jgi:ketosteroid isomerase-like protein